MQGLKAERIADEAILVYNLAREIAEAIAEEMQRQGVSKMALARRIGRPKIFVCQCLRGERQLTLRSLAAIAEALGCRVEVRLDPSSRTGRKSRASLRSAPPGSSSPLPPGTRTASAESRTDGGTGAF